jgi:hypothetical protein
MTIDAHAKAHEQGKKRLIELTKADPDAKPQPEPLKTPTASTPHSTENPNPRNPFFPVKNTPRAQARK